MTTSGRPPSLQHPPRSSGPCGLFVTVWTSEHHGGSSGPAGPSRVESPAAGGAWLPSLLSAPRAPAHPLPAAAPRPEPATQGPAKGPLDQRHALAWEGWAPGSPGALCLLARSQTGTLPLLRAVPFMNCWKSVLPVCPRPRGWDRGDMGVMCQAADSRLALRQPPPDKPSSCCCASLDVPQSEGLAGGGWAEWLPGYDQPQCVPEATVVPTALAVPQGHACREGQQCQARAGVWGPGRSAEPSGPGPFPAGPVLIVVLVVIMKMLGERVSLHCDVELEIIS